MKRKTSADFFTSLVPQLNMTANVTCNNSRISQGSAVPEPKTALSAFTKVTFCSSALNSQQERHMKQGPMRSEKVNQLTKLIKLKADQLMKEREIIEEHYKDVDYQQDCCKEELRH